MNYARVVMAGVAAWVASMMIGFVVNTYLLASIFAANAAVMRPESEINALLPLGFVVLLFGYLGSAWIYASMYQAGYGPAEGARFGVVVAIIVTAFGLIWQYIQYPISGMMLAALVGDAIVEMAIYGAIIGAIYKPK
jgi:hypothetical protein